MVVARLISNIKYRALTHIECRVIVSCSRRFTRVSTNKYPWTWRAAACNAFLLAKSKPTCASRDSRSLRFEPVSRMTWKNSRRGTTSSVSFERSLKKGKRRKESVRCRFVCQLTCNRSKWYSAVKEKKKKREKKRKKKGYVRAAVVFARNVIGYPFHGTLESHTVYTTAF